MALQKGRNTKPIALFRSGWLRPLLGHRAFRRLRSPWLHTHVILRAPLQGTKHAILSGETWGAMSPAAFIWWEAGWRPSEVLKGTIPRSPRESNKGDGGVSATGTVKQKLATEVNEDPPISLTRVLAHHHRTEGQMAASYSQWSRMGFPWGEMLSEKDGRWSAARQANNAVEGEGMRTQPHAHALEAKRELSAGNEVLERRPDGNRQPSPNMEAGAPSPVGGNALYPLMHFPHVLMDRRMRWLPEVSRTAHIHTDAHAHAFACRHGAEAVTVGRDIFMKYGKFNAATVEGVALLVHELTHVRQGSESGSRTDERIFGAGRDRLEREAHGIERSILKILSEPAGTDTRRWETMERATPARMEFPRIQRATTVGHGSAGEGIRPSEGSNRHESTTVFRAAEGRDATAGGPVDSTAADAVEVASLAAALVERRLRIDRERYGLARL
jgi:hypothetical protein